MRDRLFHILGREVHRYELPMGLAVLALLCYLLLLELVVLEGQGNGLVRNGLHPLLETLMQPPLFVLLVLLISTALLLQVLGKRQTVLRPLALICLYRGAQELITGSLVLSSIVIVVAVGALLHAMLQNIDNSFCSKDIAPQINPLNVLYFTAMEVAVVWLRASSISNVVGLGVCSSLFLAMLVKRVLQPYLNPLLQVVEVCFLALLCTHSLLGIGLAVGSTSSSSFLQKYLLELVTLLLLPTLLALSPHFQLKHLKTEMPYITVEVLCDNLVPALRELHLPFITANLLRYCNRLNRYVYYEMMDRWQPLPEPINMFNREYWALFIYRVSTDMQHTTGSDSALESFDLMLNMFYFEYHYTCNWMKCMGILQYLNRKIKRLRVMTPVTFIQRLLLIQAEDVLRQGFDKMFQTKKSLCEFDEVNALLMNLMSAAEGYRQLWSFLCLRHVHIDEAIDRVDELLKKVDYINEKVGELNFRSLYLEGCLVNFDVAVRMDPIAANNRSVKQLKWVEAKKLDPDLSDYIFLEITLERKNIGQFITSGLNIGRLLLPEGRSRSTLNLRDLLPECLQGYHQQAIDEFVYGYHTIDEITPFIKNSFCLNGSYLERIEVRTNLCLINQYLTAVGFMKLIREYNMLLLLCNKITGEILEASYRMALAIQTIQERLSYPSKNLFSLLGFDCLEHGKRLNLDCMDDRSITYELKCLKTIRHGTSEQNSSGTVIYLLQLVENVRNPTKTLICSDKRSNERRFNQSSIREDPNLICLTDSSTLPTYFNYKSRLERKHHSHMYLKLFLGTLCCGLLLLLLKGGEMTLQSQCFKAVYNHTSIMKQSAARNLLNNRMILEAEFFSLVQTGKHNLDANALKRDLEETISDLGKVTTSLASITSTYPKHTVINGPNSSGFKMSSTLLLLEAVSKCRLLANINFSNVSSLTQLQIDSAIWFVLQNYKEMMQASDDADLKDMYAQIHVTVNTLGWGGRVCAALVLVCVVTVLVMVVLLEVRVVALKRDACYTLFRLGEKDLEWMSFRAKTFVNTLKSLDSNDNSESLKYSGRYVEDEKLQKLYPLVNSEVDSMTMTDSALTGTLTTERFRQKRTTMAFGRSTLQNNKQFRKIVYPKVESTPPAPINRIFNNPRRFAAGLLVVYLLVVGGVLAFEMLGILATVNIPNSTETASNEFNIISTCQLSLTSIYNQFFRALRTGQFSLSLFDNASNNYGTARKDILQLAGTTNGNFNQLLNQILYSNVSQYQAASIPLNMNMDSLLSTEVTSMRANLLQYNAAVSDYFINWSVIVEDIVYHSFDNLASGYLQEYEAKTLNCISRNGYWSIGTLACASLLLIITVIHVVSARRRRLRLLQILQLLKRDNFMEEAIKKSISATNNKREEQEAMLTTDALVTAFGKTLIESEKSFT